MGAPCGASAKIPSSSNRGLMIGCVSQVGSGDASSVLDLESADGHDWRRRWESCVQRGSGTVVICFATLTISETTTKLGQGFNLVCFPPEKSHFGDIGIPNRRVSRDIKQAVLPEKGVEQIVFLNIE